MWGGWREEVSCGGVSVGEGVSGAGGEYECVCVYVCVPVGEVCMSIYMCV